LEVIFRHFDVGKKGTIHFGQLEDMMTALKVGLAQHRRYLAGN